MDVRDQSRPGANVLARLERHVVETAERSGRSVALVGVSLGGTMAREVAKRRPECISRVMTICQS
jgi:hypothetical protein